MRDEQPLWKTLCEVAPSSHLHTRRFSDRQPKKCFPVSQLPKASAKLFAQSHWMQRPVPIPTAPRDHPGFVWEESKLPGAEQVKTGSAFVHSHSRRNDSMLWLQSLQEQARGKLNLPQTFPNEEGNQSLGEGIIFSVP